jgi:hypothetical protein
MFAIYEKASGKEVCKPSTGTTARKAWDYFKLHRLDALQTPDGQSLSRLKGPRHYANFYVCKSLETRAPALRVAGHKLTTDWNGERGPESSATGRCTCGWSETCGSRESVKQEFQHHLRRVAEK